MFFDSLLIMSTMIIIIIIIIIITFARSISADVNTLPLAPRAQIFFNRVDTYWLITST